MLNLFNNTNIFIWIEKLINFINSIFFVLLLIALSFALIFSPPDYLQGDSVRIMYVHVPAAWIGLASFSCIALLSIFNNKKYCTYRFDVYLFSNCNRIYMGSAHMGNFLGMGCTYNINGNFGTILFNVYSYT